MGRQKAVIKARREAKRVIRRDARSHRQLEEESVTSLVQMGESSLSAWRETSAIAHPSRLEPKLRVITYQP